MKRILVVDDDAELRANFLEILQDAGYSAEAVASGLEAIERAREERFDVILLDLVMPGVKGIDALVELRKYAPRSRVIMITAFATVQSAVEAIRKGASDYITKPFKIEEFLSTIGRVLEEARFGERIEKTGLDEALSSLSNPIRRKILRMLDSRASMRLMEITRELQVEDHTKIVFHLKTLKESGMIEQNEDKSYRLTPNGKKILTGLDHLEEHLPG